MRHEVKIPDHSITQAVTQHLSNRGVRSPCHVIVATNQGNVTLSGTIQYEHQRHMVVQVTRGVQGVQRVSDQLHLMSNVQRWA
jgi:osmotically-inducible protein OsmY